MIADNIMLAAHFLGVASCYIGKAGEVFTTEYGMKKRREWDIPEDMVAVCNVVLGCRGRPGTPC